MSDRKIQKDNREKDILGDKTAYGEFVSTFHHWTGLESNHKRGAELEQAGQQKKTSTRKNSISTKEE